MSTPKSALVYELRRFFIEYERPPTPADIKSDEFRYDSELIKSHFGDLANATEQADIGTMKSIMDTLQEKGIYPTSEHINDEIPVSKGVFWRLYPIRGDAMGQTVAIATDEVIDTLKQWTAENGTSPPPTPTDLSEEMDITPTQLLKECSPWVDFLTTNLPPHFPEPIEADNIIVACLAEKHKTGNNPSKRDVANRLNLSGPDQISDIVPWPVAMQEVRQCKIDQEQNIEPDSDTRRGILYKTLKVAYYLNAVPSLAQITNFTTLNSRSNIYYYFDSREDLLESAGLPH